MNYLNKFVTALREAFSSFSEMETFLMLQMSLNLHDITPPVELPTVFLRLSRHLVSIGRIEEFIEKAAEEKPTPRLKALVANLALVGAGIRESSDSELDDEELLGDPVKASLRDLSSGIQARLNLFGYMNAYKRLHEILHGLHREYPVLDMAVQTRMRDVKQPLSRGAYGLLRDLISEAEEACRDSEFGEAPDWVNCLQNAFDELTSDNADNWMGALSELQRLPAKEMRPLNDLLVDSARRIGFDALAELASNILSSLTAELTPAELTSEWKDLQQAVTVFHKRCMRMDCLVKIHNICQLIDERLAPMRSPFPMAPKLYEWRSIMRRLSEVHQIALSEVAGRSINNDIAGRVSDTFEAASAYQKAASAEEADRSFEEFRVAFNDLFDAVDKEVLKTCSEICGSINRLADRLKERL